MTDQPPPRRRKGAFAIGVLAIRRLAIRRLEIDDAELKSLHLETLEVGHLRAARVTVTDRLELPEGRSTPTIRS